MDISVRDAMEIAEYVTGEKERVKKRTLQIVKKHLMENSITTSKVIEEINQIPTFPIYIGG